jgi:hypothetical protein
MNAADHEHFVFGLNLAPDISRQPAVACVDLSRFQRAPEGAGQSAAGGSYDVIECRGVRL